MQDSADSHWTSLLRNGRPLNTSSSNRNRSRSRSSDAAHRGKVATPTITKTIPLSSAAPVAPYHDTGFVHTPIPITSIPPPISSVVPSYSSSLPKSPPRHGASFSVGLGPISQRAHSFASGGTNRPLASVIGSSANSAVQHTHVSPSRPDFLNSIWDGPVAPSAPPAGSNPVGGLVGVSGPPVPTAERCGDCGGTPELECIDCNEVYCKSCYQTAHAKGRRKDHKNVRPVVAQSFASFGNPIPSDIEEKLRFYENEHQAYASNFSRVQQSLEAAVQQIHSKDRELQEAYAQISGLHRKIQDLESLLQRQVHVAESFTGGVAPSSTTAVKDSYNQLLNKAQTDLQGLQAEFQRREQHQPPTSLYR
eukprot:PhF_6_TR22362/c0_g1_i1/m.31697